MMMYNVFTVKLAMVQPYKHMLTHNHIWYSKSLKFLPTILTMNDNM